MEDSVCNKSEWKACNVDVKLLHGYLQDLGTTIQAAEFTSFKVGLFYLGYVKFLFPGLFVCNYILKSSKDSLLEQSTPMHRLCIRGVVVMYSVKEIWQVGAGPPKNIFFWQSRGQNANTGSCQEFIQGILSSKERWYCRDLSRFSWNVLELFVKVYHWANCVVAPKGIHVSFLNFCILHIQRYRLLWMFER